MATTPAQKRILNLTANSFTKIGGTSSQFLKADGSVDMNAYITGITAINDNLNPNQHQIATVEGITISETVTQLNTPTLSGNVLSLKLLNENNVEQVVTIDLSSIVTNESGISNATYDAATNIITLNETDGDTHTIDLSEFSIISNTDAEGVTTLTQEGVIKLTVSKVGQSGQFSDILSLPTTISGYGITDAVTTNTSQTITGVKTFSNGFIDSITNIGKTTTPYESLATGEWAAPVGTSRFLQANSVGSVGYAGYWTILGRRDVSGGYAGIYVPYGTTYNNVHIGISQNSGDPTWMKLWTEKNLNKLSDLTDDLNHLSKTGGDMTGNINFTETSEGITWNMNSDGAKILFHNTSDGDTNSYLEFQTFDNGNEHFKWTHTSGATTYDMMKLSDHDNPLLEVYGKLETNGDITLNGGVSRQLNIGTGTIIRDNNSGATVISQNGASGAIYFRPQGNASSIGQSVLNNSGSWSIDGQVSAKKFVHTTSDDNYILLGGGGTKLLSELSSEGHTHPQSEIEFVTTANGIDGNISDASLWDRGVSLQMVSGNNSTYPVGYGTVATFKEGDGRIFQFFHQNAAGSANLWVRSLYHQNASEWHKIWNDGNLTNVSQLANDAGYLTSYTDTLQSVTDRGNVTTNSIHINRTVDASETSGTTHALTLGDVNGLNIGIDNNEIIARNSTALSELYINTNGAHFQGGYIYENSQRVATQNWTNSNYDNYQSWNLKTNGVQRTTVQSGGTLDIVAQNNISASYSAGGVVTLDGTHNHNEFTKLAYASDLNTIRTDNEYRFAFHRYTSSAANKPYSGNNANGVITMQTHSGTGAYGKQIAFGDNEDLYMRRMSSGAFNAWRKLWHDGNLTKLTDLTNDLQYITPGNGLSGSTFNGSTARTWNLDEGWLNGRYFDLDGNNTATGNNTFTGENSFTGKTTYDDDVWFNTQNGLQGFYVTRYGESTTEHVKYYLEDIVANQYYQNDERHARFKWTINNTDTESNAGANANTHTFEFLGNEFGAFLYLDGAEVVTSSNISSHESNTTYSAGTGISLTGTTFNFDTSWGDTRYLQSYSETDTLATVTGRGSSTSTRIDLNGGFIGTHYGGASGASSAPIWNVSPDYTNWGIFYTQATPDTIDFRSAGSTNAKIALDTGDIYTVGTMFAKTIQPNTSDGITIGGDFNNGTDRGASLYMGGNTSAIARFDIGDTNQDIDGEFIVRNRSTTTLGTALFDHMSSVRFNVDGTDSVYHEFTSTQYKFKNNDSIPDGTEIGLGEILLLGGSGGNNTMRIAQSGSNTDSVIDSSTTLVVSAGSADYTFTTSGGMIISGRTSDDVLLGNGTFASLSNLGGGGYSNAVKGTNIAAGVLSTNQSSGGAAIATDGNKDTLSYVSFGSGSVGASGSEGTNYLQLDLGAEYSIYSSQIWFYDNDGRYYWYNLQYSTDGTNWSYAVGSPGTFIQSDGVKDQPDVIEFSTTPIIARYFRVYGNGNSVNTSNHLYEWEIYENTGSNSSVFNKPVLEVSTDGLSHTPNRVEFNEKWHNMSGENQKFVLSENESWQVSDEVEGSNTGTTNLLIEPQGTIQIVTPEGYDNLIAPGGTFGIKFMTPNKCVLVGALMEGATGGSSNYDPDYQAVLDFASNNSIPLPSPAQQDIDNQLLIDYKATGAWAKDDVFFKFTGDADPAFKLICWKRLIQADAFGSLTWNSDGVLGNGANGYIDSKFSPSVDGVNFTQNDAGLTTVFHAVSQSTGGCICGGYDGVNGAGYTVWSDWYQSATGLNYLNSRYEENTRFYDETGFAGLYRTSSTSVTKVKNSSSSTYTDSSTGLLAKPLYIMGRARHDNGSHDIFGDAHLKYFTMGGSKVNEVAGMKPVLI